MGFRFRKSINLGGGFRINISKSGIGYSWGVKGFRITQTSRGTTRKTYSIPGTGFSYVEERSNKSPHYENNHFQPTNDNIYAEEKFINEISEIDNNNTNYSKLPDFNTSRNEILDKETSDKDFLKTLLLCLFLGGLGAHRFYSGKYKTAIAQLLLAICPFTTFIAVIWAFVDLINILSKKWFSSKCIPVIQEDGSIIQTFDENDCEKDILALAQKSIEWNALANVFIVLTIIIALAAPKFSFLFLFAVTFKIYCRIKGIIDLDYDIDEESLGVIRNKMLPMVRVAQCAKVWRVNSSSGVIDTKYSAGATSLIKRTQCIALTKAVFPFKSKMNAVSFISPNETIIFLPDRLFIIQGTKIASVNYTDMDISADTTDFIEEEILPRDAQVIRYTWKYVNKSGGPDRRFKDNKEIPVCLYGQLKFKAPGVNTILMFSNTNLHQDIDYNSMRNVSDDSGIAKYVAVSILCIALVLANTLRDESQSTNSTQQNNQQQKVECKYSIYDGEEVCKEPNIVNTTSYSPEQLAYLPNHPRIGDDFSKVYEFQQIINDKRIKATDIRTYSNLEERMGYEELKKSVVLTFLKDPTNGKNLGEIKINVVEKTFAQNMTLDRALNIVKEYLPDYFTSYYKKDASFIKEGNGIKIWCYGARLNSKGDKLRSSSNLYLPYYYSFYIKQDTNNNTWEIYTDYSAYAGASVEWYNRYKRWDVNINERTN